MRNDMEIKGRLKDVYKRQAYDRGPEDQKEVQQHEEV